MDNRVVSGFLRNSGRSRQSSGKVSERRLRGCRIGIQHRTWVKSPGAAPSDIKTAAAPTSGSTAWTALP